MLYRTKNMLYYYTDESLDITKVELIAAGQILAFTKETYYDDLYKVYLSRHGRILISCDMSYLEKL